MKKLISCVGDFISARSKSIPSESGVSARFPVILLLAMAGVGLAALLAGCESASQSFDMALAAQANNSPTASAGSDSSSYGYSTNLLQEGDVVSIMFRYSTNFNTIQKISLDGTLNLQGAGEVKAVNKTVLQLQDELTRSYQSLAKDDPITVTVVTPVSAVYVTGTVNRPGKIVLEHPMTVLEAIMEAGGSIPLEANLSDVLVLRVVDQKQKVYHINVRRILDGKDSTVFYLKPFDIVRVPEKIFNY